MFIATATEAYERQPSGSPATEPITFSVDSATDVSSNCVGGYQTIGVQTEAGSPYSTGYLDWQADASTVTWTDKTCSDIAYWQGNSESCTEDFPVVETLIVCNDTADYDEMWSAYSLDGTDWTWAIEAAAPTGTTTTTTDITDTELGAYAIIVFLIAAFTGFVLIR